MATWKKVIVSGSAANLTTVQVDNLTTGEVVIGGGSSNLSTTAINGTGSIVATTGASGVTMSGSFSGSFVGDGSQLTGIATTLSGSTDSGNFEVNLLNQYLTVQGTANEIEVSGSGQTITVGLPTNVTIAGTLTVSSDLIVNGTTTVINTTNTAVADQFILLASGSTSTIDAGIIVQNAANAGEAFYWENNTAGTSRWAIASNISPTATAVTAAEYMVTANTAAGAPSAAPTYGGSSVGYGNMYVDSANGDIYIYS